MLWLIVWLHLVFPTPGILPFVGLIVPTSQVRSTPGEATSISFDEFFEAQRSDLTPSSKLMGLNKKRVKLVGFMAQMELPLEGSFYLVPHPVFCDEEGGGNADLPPGSVLVVVPSLSKQAIPFIPGPIEVVGILSLGNEEKEGRVSGIRVTLDEKTTLEKK